MIEDSSMRVHEEEDMRVREFLVKYLKEHGVMSGVMSDERGVKMERLVGYSNMVYRVSSHPVEPGSSLEERTSLSPEKKVRQFIVKYKEKRGGDNSIAARRFLASAGFGPKLYYVSEDKSEFEVIVEEYIESVTCSYYDYNKNKSILMNVILQTGKYCRVFREASSQVHGMFNPSLTRYSQLVRDGFMEKGRRNLRRLIETTSMEKYRRELEDIEKMISWVEEGGRSEEVAKEMDKREMIVCHNDAFWLNVLKVEGSERVVLIDYEDSSYNPVGSDVYLVLTEMNFFHKENPDVLVYEPKTFSKKERELLFKVYLLGLEGGLGDKESIDSSTLYDICVGTYDHLIDEDLLADLSSDRTFYRMMYLTNMIGIYFNLSLLAPVQPWDITAYTIVRLKYQIDVIIKNME